MSLKPRPLVVHLIGNAHLDPVWLWPRAEGLSEGRATFSAALERIAEYPGFLFTASAAAVYEWIERTDPALFRRIQRAVRAGRWEIVGGWQTQSDCNLPSGESFAHNALYSQRYFRERFGHYCRTGYCVDSFGHAGSLPQLLLLGGLRQYTFMRPWPAEDPLLPEGPFLWEGTDGTRVTAFHIYRNYGCSHKKELRENLDLIAQARPPLAMCFFGVGDHGGGPTRELLDRIPHIQQERPQYRLLHSTTERYFKALRPHLPKLPLFRGETGPHSAGCYTSHAGIKRLNRKTEEELGAAEKLSVCAMLATGAPPPTARLRAAWKGLLFNQFHDILAGTCEEEACREVLEHLGGARHEAREIVAEAVQRIGSAVDTRGPGTAWLAFNPHPAPWTGLIESDDFSCLEPARDRIALADAQGRPIPFQFVAPSTRAGRHRVVFEAALPPLGWQLFRRLDRGQGGPYPPAPEPRSGRLRATGSLLENEYLRLQVGRDGSLRLRDLKRRWDVFRPRGSGLPLLLDDPHDTWGHKAGRFGPPVGRFVFVGAELLEAGPLRARLRLRFRNGATRVRLDYLLGRHARAIEVRGWADWRHQNRMLKLVFGVQLGKVAGYRTEIPYGVIRRQADGQEKVMQQWVALNDARRGLALANDGKYGVDVRDGTIRLSLLRGAGFAHHLPARMPSREGRYQDQGEQEFRLLLLPHGPGSDAEITREARFFNRGPVLSQEGTHPGRLAARHRGLLEVQGPVWVDCLKGAEDGRGLVVRAYAPGERPTLASFVCPALGRRWRARFRPGEVKTFRVPLRRGRVRETDFLEG